MSKSDPDNKWYPADLAPYGVISPKIQVRPGGKVLLLGATYWKRTKSKEVKLTQLPRRALRMLAACLLAELKA